MTRTDRRCRTALRRAVGRRAARLLTAAPGAVAKWSPDGTADRLCREPRLYRRDFPVRPRGPDRESAADRHRRLAGLAAERPRGRLPGRSAATGIRRFTPSRHRAAPAGRSGSGASAADEPSLRALARRDSDCHLELAARLGRSLAARIGAASVTFHGFSRGCLLPGDPASAPTKDICDEDSAQAVLAPLLESLSKFIQLATCARLAHGAHSARTKSSAAGVCVCVSLGVPSILGFHGCRRVRRRGRARTLAN